MRAVAIAVVTEHAEHTLEMLSVQDQQPVEVLRPRGPHEPLRDAVRLRRSKRCPNVADPVASEHRVKTFSEFLVSIANEETR
jgi:hypothetical protein